MRTPYFADDRLILYTGDAVEVLAELPDESVHCVVTSPPYYGLRDYGTGTWTGGHPGCAHATGRGTTPTHARTRSAVDAPAAPPHRGGHPRVCLRCGAHRDDRQYGLEPTPADYITTLRAVFAHLWRVLNPTGTVWVNLGDCYAVSHRGSRHAGSASTLVGPSPTGGRGQEPTTRNGRPPKNLLGIPWRVALALQHDGWILRNAIVWHKPNAMPESVRDRLSTRYELLFLLVKQPRYWFDLDPIRHPLARPQALRDGRGRGGAHIGHHAGVAATARRRGPSTDGKYHDTAAFRQRQPGAALRPTGGRHTACHPHGRNPGDVWSIPTRPLRAAHFAAFPIDIPLRAIAAGCPPDGVVLDPFSGAATTGMAACQLGRSYIGIDLNPDFHDIGLDRLGRNRPQARGGQPARRAA